MATQDWKRAKSKNPYITHRWINTKKGLFLEINYDIGFDKQRNATVYDLANITWSGPKDLVTHYGSNEKDALDWAKDYMEKN